MGIINKNDMIKKESSEQADTRYCFTRGNTLKKHKVFAGS